MTGRPTPTASFLVKPHDRIYVVGAGGHGKVAVRAAQECGIHVQALFDDDPTKVGNRLFGVPIIGGFDVLEDQKPLPTLIAIGNNSQRLHLAKKIKHPPATVLHPAALVDSEAELGVGVLVLAGSIVQVDAVIGDYVVINNKAIVEHDCHVADGAHVSCGACLTGGAKVGRGTLVGANATLLPHVEVGDFVTVGAGSVVLDDLPDHVTVVGVPARVLPNLSAPTAA